MKKFSVIIRYKNLDNDKQSIYLDIYDGKSRKRKRQFLGYHIYKDPKTRLQRQENRLYLDAAEEIRIKLLTQKVLPQEVYFFEYFDKQIKNKATKRSYETIAAQLQSFLPKSILISEVTREQLENYIRFLNEKYTGSSPWLYFTKLKHIFNLAIRDEIIRSSPCDKVSTAPKRIQPEVDFLTIEDMRKLNDTDCIDPEFKRAFLFCCFTGFRLWSEALKLTWDDIEEKEGVSYCTYVIAKTGGKKRTISLNKQAVVFLGDRRPGPCFQTFFHTVTESSRILPKWLRDAGIKKKITTKAGRHTFATHVQSIGKDIYLTQKALGHAELRNTQVYAKIEDKRLKQVKESYSL